MGAYRLISKVYHARILYGNHSSSTENEIPPCVMRLPILYIVRVSDHHMTSITIDQYVTQSTLFLTIDGSAFVVLVISHL